MWDRRVFYPLPDPTCLAKGKKILCTQKTLPKHVHSICYHPVFVSCPLDMIHTHRYCSVFLFLKYQYIIVSVLFSFFSPYIWYIPILWVCIIHIWDTVQFLFTLYMIHRYRYIRLYRYINIDAVHFSFSSDI